MVCCPLTPLKKASVLRLHREQVTVAVGDGGNDVSMIQTASIVVSTREHTRSQVPRAPDYAEPESQSLRSLLHVHGHLSYMRDCGIVRDESPIEVTARFAERDEARVEVWRWRHIRQSATRLVPYFPR